MTEKIDSKVYQQSGYTGYTDIFVYSDTIPNNKYLQSVTYYIYFSTCLDVSIQYPTKQNII